MDYDVQVGELVCTVEHEYPDFSITMAAYLCRAGSREFTMKEHSSSLWVKPERLLDLPFCEADRPIAECVFQK